MAMFLMVDLCPFKWLGMLDLHLLVNYPHHVEVVHPIQGVAVDMVVVAFEMEEAGMVAVVVSEEGNHFVVDHHIEDDLDHGHGLDQGNHLFPICFLFSSLSLKFSLFL